MRVNLHQPRQESSSAKRCTTSVKASMAPGHPNRRLQSDFPKRVAPGSSCRRHLRARLRRKSRRAAELQDVDPPLSGREPLPEHCGAKGGLQLHGKVCRNRRAAQRIGARPEAGGQRHERQPGHGNAQVAGARARPDQRRSHRRASTCLSVKNPTATRATDYRLARIVRNYFRLYPFCWM